VSRRVAYRHRSARQTDLVEVHRKLIQLNAGAVLWRLGQTGWPRPVWRLHFYEAVALRQQHSRTIPQIAIRELRNAVNV